MSKSRIEGSLASTIRVRGDQVRQEKAERGGGSEFISFRCRMYRFMLSYGLILKYSEIREPLGSYSRGKGTCQMIFEKCIKLATNLENPENLEN